MPRVAFETLPDDARLWVFCAGRQLTGAEQTRLLAEVDAFLDQWGAHSQPLAGGRDLRYDRFLFVAVNQRVAGPSGCSIDALVRRMKMLEAAMGVELVDHAPVLFRQGDEIRRVPRERFAALAAAGEVDLDTTVFDATVTRLGDVRCGRWETRAGDAWHQRAFF